MPKTAREGIISAYIRRIMASVMALALLSGLALAGDKLTEANMTQRDYTRITATESSVEGQAAAEKPRAVHNFSDADTRAVTEEGGVKVIPARDWSNESPEERDAHLRRIQSTLQEGARLVITVPKGDVWLIPGTETSEADEGFENYLTVMLIIRKVLRPWSDAERAALPAAVARDKSVSQSDKHGTTQVRVQAEKEKP